MTVQDDAFIASTGAYVLGALPPGEREAFDAHMAGCAACAAETAALQPVVGLLSLSVPLVEPPAALRQRVVARAIGERPSTPPFASAPFGPVSAAPRSARRVRAERLRGWTGWLAAAASLALAIGLWAYASSLRERLGDAEAQLAVALDRWRDSERRLDAATRDVGRARLSLAVALAPDARAFALKGQAPAPRAEARAYLSRSRGLVVAASNLPPLAPGRTYQLWYLTAAAPVSAGLLQPDATGNAIVAVADVPGGIVPVGMAVSLEPEGGVPSPTGAIYLVGD